MARVFWGLVAVAVLAAGGCGRKSEKRAGTPPAAPAPVAEEPTAPAEPVSMDEQPADAEGTARTAETPAPPGESGHTIGTAAAGAAIAAKVKSTLISLSAEEGLETGNLDVKAKADGTVTLSGSVPSEAQSERIEEAALAIEGVRAVENAMTLAP